MSKLPSLIFSFFLFSFLFFPLFFFFLSRFLFSLSPLFIQTSHPLRVPHILSSFSTLPRPPRWLPPPTASGPPPLRAPSTAGPLHHVAGHLLGGHGGHLRDAAGSRPGSAALPQFRGSARAAAGAGTHRPSPGRERTRPVSHSIVVAGELEHKTSTTG